MRHVAIAAAAYFAIVLAAGSVAGVVRVAALEGWLGPVGAVAAELPVMLVVSWLAAGAVARRCRLPPTLQAGLSMGAVALGLLMLAEMALARSLRGQDLAQFLAALATPAGALGLAGQIAFALIPALRGMYERR